MIVNIILNRLVRGELGSTVMMLSLLAESIGKDNRNFSTLISPICTWWKIFESIFFWTFNM